MMRTSIMLTTVALILTLLATPRLARADGFTYTFTDDYHGGSATFSESSILTTTTTISTFTSNTISGVTSLSLAPESGDDCIGNSGISEAGPCIAENFGSTATALFYFSSNLTSTGTYDTSVGLSGTIQISEQVAAPEPSSLLSLGSGLLGLGVGIFKRRRQD